MEFLGVTTDGFSRLDIFKCRMDEEGSVIFCGDHGEGKTDALQCVMSVLSGEEYRSMDYPITRGKKRMQIDVELKVEPGDEITLMDHVFRQDVGENITVSLVKTPSGSPQLTLFNSTTGEPYKGTPTETRKIVDTFLGRFPDPHKLDKVGTSNKPSERTEFLRIVASLSKTKEGGPIDFTLFIELEKERRQIHSDHKSHLKVLRDDLSMMPVPQDDWARLGIDQKAVSDEIQRWNDHEKENTRRLQVIQEVERQLTEQNTKFIELEVQKNNLTDTIGVFSKGLMEERESIKKLESSIKSYQENNPIIEPEDTEELTRQIEALQKKLREANELKLKNQQIEKTVADQKNKVTTRAQVADQSEVSLNEKRKTKAETLDKIEAIQEKTIPAIQQEVERTKTFNQQLDWVGKKDPEGVLEALPYLNSLMSKAVVANKQVDDREKHEGQKVKIEATEKQMKEANDSINQVKVDEIAVIESSVFPHPGIRIMRDDKDKIDVYVKDKHDVWNTYNDTNHSERMRQAVNIVTYGAGGDLKLMFINEGYALLPYKRKQIIEEANRKGYKVMMEAFTAEEGENAVYLGEHPNPQSATFDAPIPEERQKSGIPAFGETK